MRIRREQMQAFDNAVLRSFQDEMLKHSKEFAPRHCEVIGDEAVREVIQLGIERAEQYGLTNRGPIRFYLEMMFIFGSDFDTDPQLPWATEILNDVLTPDQMQRAERLYEKMKHYTANVDGPDNRYVVDAMERIRRVNPRDYLFPDGAFSNSMRREMKRFYPQKCEYVGDRALEALIQRGIKMAEGYSITVNRNTAMFIMLLFAVGHGFVTDPQYRWAAKALKDTAEIDPNKRVERLVIKVMVYLDAALNHLEGR